MRFVFQFFLYILGGLNNKVAEPITKSRSIFISIHSPDFLSKKEVGEAGHMGSRPVLLLGDQHQPQHPVDPFQLWHLGYFSFSCLPGQSDLFEKDKVASNPVCIVELPAAEHRTHACLLVNVIVEIICWSMLLLRSSPAHQGYC